MNLRPRASTIVALLCLAITPPAYATAASSAKGVIEQFYRSYFASSMTTPSRPPFSDAFRAADAVNKKLCKERARQGDVCGWDSDADPYLDAQDYDSHLTYENAIISLQEPAPGRIAVTLGLFLSHRTENTLRTITYVMIQEHGRWVVDDIVYPEGPSARKIIQIEIGATP